MARLTVKDLLDAKGTRRFCQVYIRNAKEAAACNAAGVDMVIHWEGGDIAAVRAAAPDTFLTVGLVYGRHASIPEALGAAYRALELGADAVYCPQSLAYVEAFAAEAIPTVGHVGFVPYKRTWVGGFKAVGKTLETTEVELMNTVFPHPTLSEMMHESVLAAYGRALHI